MLVEVMLLLQSIQLWEELLGDILFERVTLRCLGDPWDIFRGHWVLFTCSGVRDRGWG